MVFTQYIIVLSIISKKEIKPFLSVLVICLDLPFLGFMYKLDLLLNSNFLSNNFVVK